MRAIDGTYESATIDAVKKLQKALGVNDDGVFGNDTAESLLAKLSGAEREEDRREGEIQRRRREKTKTELKELRESSYETFIENIQKNNPDIAGFIVQVREKNRNALTPKNSGYAIIKEFSARQETREFVTIGSKIFYSKEKNKSERNTNRLYGLLGSTEIYIVLSQARNKSSFVKVEETSDGYQEMGGTRLFDKSGNVINTNTTDNNSDSESSRLTDDDFNSRAERSEKIKKMLKRINITSIHGEEIKSDLNRLFLMDRRKLNTMNIENISPGTILYAIKDRTISPYQDKENYSRVYLLDASNDIFFSESENARMAFEINRVFKKLGDKDSIYMLPAGKNREFVSVEKKIYDENPFYVEKNNNNRLFDQSGNVATKDAEGKYTFEKGEFENDTFKISKDGELEKV